MDARRWLQRARRTMHWRTGLLVLAFCAAGLGACGGDEESGGSTADSATSRANKARATAILAPFLGRPSTFPVDRPLKSAPPASTTIAFVDCGTPVCTLLRGLAVDAAETAGVRMQVYRAGGSASAVNAAFNAVLASKPDAVFVSAIDPSLWSPAVDELEQAEIPVIGAGYVNGEEFGLTTPPNAVVSGAEQFETAGELLAAYVYSTEGPGTEVAFTHTPELAFSSLVQSSFTETLESLCSDCEVREVQVPITALGSTAPRLIVSDLQAHPNTDVVTGSSGETQTGLPASLATAGLDVKLVSTFPTPANLADLKAGKVDAAVALDIATGTWTAVDAALRAAQGEPFVGTEASGAPPMQLLRRQDVTFDPSRGWTGYPDFTERFANLWSPGQ